MKKLFLNDTTTRSVICVKKADGLVEGEKYTLIKILQENDDVFVKILENPKVNYMESYFAEDENSKLSAVRGYLKDRGRHYKRICMFTCKTAPALLLSGCYRFYLKYYKDHLEKMKPGDTLVFGAPSSWENGICDIKLGRGKYNINPIHFFVQRCEEHFELYDCSKLGTCINLVPFSGKSI